MAITIQRCIELNNDVIDYFIKTILKTYDNELFPDKTKNDKYVCLICNRTTTRSNKFQHVQSNKHIKCLSEFKDKLAKVLKEYTNDRFIEDSDDD